AFALGQKSSYFLFSRGFDSLIRTLLNRKFIAVGGESSPRYPMSTPAMVTYPCLSHALPFRTILGEYKARRRQDLAIAVTRFVLGESEVPEDETRVWSALDDALNRSEDAYRELLAAKDLLDHVRRDADDTTEAYSARVELGQDQVLQCEHECST